MSRFVHEKKRSASLSLILSVGIFLSILAIFFAGLNMLSKKTLTEQKFSLEAALRRSVIECYAVEGAYPQSLAYLEQHYSISYNKANFYVDYQPIGENIMPEITVIMKEAAQ